MTFQPAKGGEWIPADQWCRAKARPTCIIRLRAKPGIDPIKALRSALKALGRGYGLQALSVHEERSCG